MKKFMLLMAASMILFGSILTSCEKSEKVDKPGEEHVGGGAQ